MTQPRFPDEQKFPAPPRAADLPGDIAQQANRRWRRVAPLDLIELLEAEPAPGLQEPQS